jgi:hypothetical protein
MLQIAALTFQFVTTVDYAECGEPLEDIWQAHLAAVGGFDANKEKPILGGAEEALACAIPT